MSRPEKPKRPKSSGPSTSRGRGSYTPHACGYCRLRRIKCTGEKPICGTCLLSGHESDCTWGAEPVKRPSTKQYVESLKKHIQALDDYVSKLEAGLAVCRNEHEGFREAHQYSRPVMSSVLPSGLGLEIAMEDEEPYEESDSEDDDSDINQLLVPTNKLVIQYEHTQLYGSTSPFVHLQTPGRINRFPEIFENYHARYVLMTDDNEASHFNPNFEWARHLPAEVPLTRREHDKVLDLLFKFFTSWCLRIVPTLFLRDMFRALSVPAVQAAPKTPHYSPMLHNALMSLATAFSDDPRIRDLNSRQYFARKAKTYMEAEVHRPNISVLHALSILGSFHSSQGEQTLGYVYFGMSGRISQALGLGIDCSPWVESSHISNDDKLDRNWAHWTTFSQDVCWSLYVGREFCVPEPSSMTSIPVPFVDSEFDQLPWHYPPSGIPPQPSRLSWTFAETCELLKIARRIMEVLKGLNNRTEVNHTLISRIDVQLNTWKDRVRPEVDITPSTRATALPHRIMLLLAYWWLHILLHRPFYRPSRARPPIEKVIDHAKLCNRAAENIMELIDTYRKLYSLRFVPVTFIQIIFSAGTVSLLSAVHATSGLRLAPRSLSDSLSQAELCIQYLSETGQSWNCANNIGEILGNLLREQLQPRLEMRSLEPKKRRNTNASSTADSPVSKKSNERPPPKPISIKRTGSKPFNTVTGTSSLSSSPVQYFHDVHSPRSDKQASGSQYASQSRDDSLMSDADKADTYGTGMMGGNVGFATFGPGMPGGHMLSPHPFVLLGEPDLSGGPLLPGPEPSIPQLTPEEEAAVRQFWESFSQS